MKKVLITGCEGFIGSNLWDYLENKGFNVFGIDIICSESKNKFIITYNSQNII